MITGCPVCPNRREAERTQDINAFLVQERARGRRRTKILCLFFSLSLGLLLSTSQCVRERTGDWSARRCNEIVKMKDMTYFNGKCYLLQDDGNLDFIVDLSKLE